MPIIGLTDRGSAFPQIGNIRKGARKEADRPGADLKYFRVEFDESESQAAAEFAALYTDKPNGIVIVMPFPEIDRVWDAWREAYTAGAMIHRCDGEHVVYAIDPKTGENIVRSGRDVNTGEPVACTLKDNPNRAARCKPTGRLNVIIPHIKRLAYLTVHTTSIYDIANISKQLAAIRDLNGGSIAGIPLVLSRKPYKISTPSGENGKKARREKWLISIEADPKWVAAKLGAMQQAALPEYEIKQLASAQPRTSPSLLESVTNYDDEEDADETEWPTTREEFIAWKDEHDFSAGDIKSALGESANEWIKAHGGDYAGCAATLWATLKPEPEEAKAEA